MRRSYARRCSFVAAAIKVTDGTVEVVSERHWKRFTANESR
jgi:hypothetical protein